MIVLKKGPCVDCPPGSPDKKLIAGRCGTHYWANLAKKSASKKNKINKSKPNEPSKNDVCLPFACVFASKHWFDYHISNCEWVCENCGEPIQPISHWAKISAQAHILPKEHFPSVKLLLENHLTLGHTDCNCHNKWDQSWESASKMKIFPIAHAKVSKFIPLLNEAELRRLPEIFKNELPKTV